MRILCVPGLGDLTWCLTKIQDISNKLGDGIIDAKIGVWSHSKIELRALDFAKRFKFINSVEPYVMPNSGNQSGPFLLDGPPADENGCYRYIADGVHPELEDIDYVLVPNASLEKGIRLEAWLQDFQINWNIMDEFQFTEEEIHYADRFRDNVGDYVCFFMASQESNTNGGHNRSGLFSPSDWIALGNKLHELYNSNIVVIGASWDNDYYNYNIRPHVRLKGWWKNYIDQWPIAQTLAVIKKSRFIVSYQSGLANVAHYMNVPTVEFWRPKGNSLSRDHYISFEESMAEAWCNKELLKQNIFMGAIYTKHGVLEILKFIQDNKW